MSAGFDPHKIAIIIPLFNDAANIERAITSALQQKLPEGFDLEVIVVDDCSTDDGFEIATRLAGAHAHLTALRQDQNQGPSAARNTALAQSNAGWFTPLDSDDFIAPDRIMKLMNVARESNLVWVADNLLISREDTPTKVERTLWPEKPEGHVELSAAFFANRCFDVDTPRSELGFLKPVINRTRLSSGLQPYREDLRFGEDFELYTRTLLDGAKAWLVDPCGYYLVQRAGSASHSQNGRDHRQLAKISREMSRREGIHPEARKALQKHCAYSEKEAAMWSIIDGVRDKNPRLMLSAFGYSLPASIHVITQVTQTAIRKLSSK